MADQTLLNKQKIKILERMLYGDHALIHLIPEMDGVVLPEHLAKDPTVTLKISKLFNGYLNLEKDTLETELRFSGSYFECIIPYEAIWGATDEKGQSSIWPESAPEAMLTQLLEAEKKATEAAQARDKKEPQKEDEDDQSSGSNDTAKKRPQLRLVKS